MKSVAEITPSTWTSRITRSCAAAWFRGLVSIGLLAVVFAAVDVHSALQLLIGTEYTYLATALFFLCVNKLAMAGRWNLLTQVKGMTLSLGESLKISLISNFVGSFLPSGIGSDVYRIYRTARIEGRTGEVAASVIMERVIGMITRSMVAVLGVILILNTHQQTSFGQNLYAVILGFCALSVIAFWISIHDRTVKILIRFADWWRDYWILKQALKFQKAYVGYKKHYGALILAFMLSLVSVVLLSVGNYYAARALSIDVGAIFYFGIISIVNIVNRIPVSVGGLGVTEGAYVVLFSSIGVSTTEALTLALLVRLADCVFAVAGWVLYLTDAHYELSGKEARL